ncbi:MAG: hypothetical protein U9N77_10720 [Thermodesulfobacteriota bacterium]|nr:hypothetical protein [Thermodesulfobacteriota bacterium]
MKVLANQECNFHHLLCADLDHQGCPWQLYKKTNEIMFNDFGFKSGTSLEQTSPLNIKKPARPERGIRIGNNKQ